MRDEEAEVFGKLVAHDRLKIWIKVISDQIKKGDEYFQSCFMCIEGRCQEEIEKIQSLLKEHKKFTWEEKAWFPWPRGIYFGEEVKTYQD